MGVSLLNPPPPASGMALGVQNQFLDLPKANLLAPPVPPAPCNSLAFHSFLPSPNRLQNQALKKQAKVGKWSSNGCPNRHPNPQNVCRTPSNSRSRTGLRTKRVQTLKMHMVVHFGMILQGPRLTKMPTGTLPKIIPNCKTCYEKRTRKNT